MPRKSVTVTSTRAPLRERTSAASAPLKRVFTGTRTAPAANRPSAATIHSTQLPHQIATRSPGSTPIPTSAAPNARASRANAAYERSVAPSRTATRSANRSAVLSSMAGMEGQGGATPSPAGPLRMVLFPYNNVTFDR